MSGGKNRVCPVERAGHLESKSRKWLQNPRRLLQPWIAEGMTVLDFGCGPGFFTIPMAQLTGPAGRVTAVDLQDGMLRKLEGKIHGAEIESRITMHRCSRDSIGVAGPFDFILAFYVVHELPDQAGFFREVREILAPHGRIFIAEPPFRVTKPEFEEMIRIAREAGLTAIDRPRLLSLFLSRAVVLEKV